MSQTFYMRTLGQFLDNLCLNNFGWFYSSLGRGGAMTYMAQWDMDNLAARLMVSGQMIERRSKLMCIFFVEQKV